MIKHNYSYTEVLVVLQEECAEVIQAVSKINRFGMTDDKQQQLLQELGDLQCMIDLCQEFDLISFTELEEYAQRKRAKLEEFSTIFG